MSDTSGSSRLSSDELKLMLEQLHTATEHFSNARRHLERALDCSGYDCPNPEVAEEELRAAHRELEAISGKVRAMLNKA
jgi:tRNA U34 5-carboxymethylaminomethyl modifying GTPase MnmE/TrmE